MAVGKAHELPGLLSKAKARPVAALIHGGDRSAVYELCQRVMNAIAGTNADALSVTRLTEVQIAGSKERVYEEFSSISMFGGEGVIWISGAGDAAAKALEPLLAGEAAGNFILIDAEALSKTSRLRKLVESHPRCVSVALYEESTHELRGRLERQIATAGLAITGDAILRLLDFISLERGVADSETQKLITYCLGQAQIELEDVTAICGDTSDVSADDLVDAIFEGRLEDADRYAATYGASLGSGRGSLSLVLQHIARLEGMAAQVSLGSSIDGVVSAPRHGIFFKRRASVAHQLRIWDTEALLGAGEKVCGAILQTRQYADLGEAIESRAILALSRMARARQSSAK